MSWKVAGTTVDQYTKAYIDENGLIAYEGGWKKAFHDLGFEEISKKQAAKISGASEEEMESSTPLQDSNTYNQSSRVSHDLNYGIKDTPGGVLISLKEHEFGDVRGNYAENKFMFKKGTKIEDEMQEGLYDILDPKVNLTNDEGEYAELDGGASGVPNWDSPEQPDSDELEKVVEEYAKKNGKPAEFSKEKIKSYAKGGRIPKTGVARLHKGEVVLPACVTRRHTQAYQKSRRRHHSQMKHYSPIHGPGWFREPVKHGLASKKGWRNRRR